MINLEQLPKLKAFSQHGVDLLRESGDSNVIANCPFCGAKEKLYINHTNKNWDCKKCQLSGGFARFLEEISKTVFKATLKEDLLKLGKEKGITVETLQRWQVGYNRKIDRYIIPVPSLEYGFSDLRIYKLGDKVHSCRDAKVNIHNLKSLSEDRTNRPIYICEGDWDFLVMDELLRLTKTEGIAIGIPGAGTFKAEWNVLFKNKTLHFIYDNDDAGKKGENKAYKSLKAIAKKITFTHWPEDKLEGFDLRDLYLECKRKPVETFNMVKSFFQDSARQTEIDESLSDKESAPNEFGKKKIKSLTTKIIPYQEIIGGYLKWLHLPNPDFIHILFGTLLANRLQGEPIWLFLVAPPGSSKSVSLMSFQHADKVLTTTSITGPSLISGFSGAGGDPSLIPKLDGKVLIIKDFTTVLSMPLIQRDEIFGILRDAYDGRVEKYFGNNVVRAYDSKFGLICGVTPAIDILGENHSSLGERFLKYRYRYDDWYQVIKRALGNSNQENQLREELSDLAVKALGYEYEKKIPEIDNVTQERIILLAQWTAIMRGSVSRDRYTQEVIYKPSPEIGTRLAKQFGKLATGLAMFRDTPKIVDEDYKMIIQVARDTLSEKNEEIFRKIYIKDKDRLWTSKEISDLTKLPTSTCMRVLQDLNMLKVLDKDKKEREIAFRVSDFTKDLTERSGVYSQRF